MGLKHLSQDGHRQSGGICIWPIDVTKQLRKRQKSSLLLQGTLDRVLTQKLHHSIGKRNTEGNNKIGSANIVAEQGAVRRVRCMPFVTADLFRNAGVAVEMRKGGFCRFLHV